MANAIVVTQQRACLFLLLAVFGLGACGTQSSPPATPATKTDPEQISVQLNEPFTLSVDQTAELAELGFRLTFHDVLEESRCPSKVQCAHAGQARISIRVSQSGQDSTTLEMNTNPPLRQDIVNYASWQIQLVALAPYPEDIDQGIPVHAYEATFIMTELQ